MKVQFKFKKWRKKYLKQFLLIVLLLTPLTVIYNSCEGYFHSPILFSRGLSLLGSQFKIIIDEGSVYTRNEIVKLTFTIPPKDKKRGEFNYEFKISNNADCKGGEWEVYTPKKDWNLIIDSNRKEGEYFVSAQFREERKEGVNYILQYEDSETESVCFSDSIFFDSLPPRSLQFDLKPSSTTNAQDITFRISAIDPSPISYQCKLLKKIRADFSNECSNNLNSFEEMIEEEFTERVEQGGERREDGWATCLPSISFESLGEACYAFTVQALDIVGNTSLASTYYWEIDRSAPTIHLEPPLPKAVTNHVGPTRFRFTKSEEDLKTTCRRNNEDESVFDSCESSFNFTPSEGDNTFEIIGIDSLGNETNSLFSWIVDVEPPTLEWDSRSPLPSTRILSTLPHIEFHMIARDNHDTSNISLNYQIYEDDQPISSIGSVNCHQGRCSAHISNPSLGDNSPPGSEKMFRIVFSAEDGAGNVSQSNLSHAWTVTFVRATRTVTQTELIKAVASLDILFVVDDSASMRREQDKFKNEFESFTSHISDLDWRTAFTTTDPVSLRSGIHRGPDGLFVQIQSSESVTPIPNTYYMISSNSNSNTQGNFKNTISSIGIKGKWPETGIRNTYRAIQRYYECKTNTVSANLGGYGCNDILESKPNRDFFRERSTLAVVLISDTDENERYSSDLFPIHPFAKHSLETFPYIELNEYVKSVFGANKKFIFNSIVHKGERPPQDCISEIAGPWKVVGCDPMRLSLLTDGYIIDITPPSYTAELRELSQSISERTSQTLTLECLPLESHSLSIDYTFPSEDHTKSDCIPMTEGRISSSSFRQENKNLHFNSELCPGSYEVTYTCYEDSPP